MEEPNICFFTPFQEFKKTPDFVKLVPQGTSFLAVLNA
jgi:hypothetical protein